MALQADWIDAIFARLALAYGGRFMAQYEGLQAEHVKTAWGTELDGVTSRGIAHALRNLPGDFPVNAMQFRRLCREAHTPDKPALPAPKGHATPADLERLARAVAPLRAPQDPKAWAHRLKAREEGGERLSRVQREAWRTALGSSHARNDTASIGAGYSPIQDDSTVNSTGTDHG